MLVETNYDLRGVVGFAACSRCHCLPEQILGLRFFFLAVMLALKLFESLTLNKFTDQERQKSSWH